MNSSQKIRVGMVISTYYPVWGGVQRQLDQIGEYLRDEGVDLFILTRKLPKTSFFELKNQTPVFRIPVTNISKRLDSFLFISLSVIWLLKNKSKFDILHCYQMYSPTTIGAFVKKIIPSKKIVVKVTSSNEYGEAKEIKKLPFYNIRSKLLKIVDKFFVVNKKIIHELSELDIPAEKISYMPNGVCLPPDKLLCDSEKNSLKRSLNLPFDKIVIFTGRITEEKNLAKLLFSWQIVKNRCPQAHLIMLGEGGRERNSLDAINQLREKLRLTQSVHLVGKINNVFDYLLSSDVFVLPSISEGLSNSLLEAMAAGLGIVAADNDGNRQAITDERNGILVNAQNVESISSAIIKLIEDDDHRKLLGIEARKTAIKDFSMKKIAGEYACSYRELLLNK